MTNPKQVFNAGFTIPASQELMGDAAPDLWGHLADWLYRSLDRELHPWKYPDRSPFPEIVLFPRMQQLTDWWERRKAKAEWDDAWEDYE